MILKIKIMYYGFCSRNISVKWESPEAQRSIEGKRLTPESSETRKFSVEDAWRAFRSKQSDTLQRWIQYAQQYKAKNQLWADFAAITATPRPPLEVDMAKQIKNDCDKSQSEILTETYKSLMEYFKRKGFSEQQSTQLGGQFMRWNGIRFQEAMKRYDDPQILKRELKSYAREYSKMVQSQWYEAVIAKGKTEYETELAKTVPPTIVEEKWNPDATSSTTSSAVDEPSAISGSHIEPESPQKSAHLEDKDADFDAVFEKWSIDAAVEKYAGTVESANVFYQNNGFYPEAYTKDNGEIVSPSELTSHPHSIEVPMTQLVDAQRGVVTPTEMIFENLPPGTTRGIILPYEWWLAEAECRALPNGDYVIKLPDGVDYYINAKWSLAEAKKETEFLSTILKTPIVRRLLLAGSDRFSQYRVDLAKRHPDIPGVSIDSEKFIDITLMHISKKCNEPPEVWDKLKEETRLAGNIEWIQSTLLIHRHRLIEALRRSGVMPEEGRQMIKPELILS